MNPLKSWQTTVLGVIVLIAVLGTTLAEGLPLIFGGDWLGFIAVLQKHWDAIHTALSALGIGLIVAADARQVSKATAPTPTS